MKKCIILFLLMSQWLFSLAQQSERDNAIAALKHVTQTYLSTPYLSFDISYYYATQAKPDTYLDSLKGGFKMNGNQYWYSLDSMETMTDSVNVVVLYKQDQVMYLSNNSGQQQKGNPVTLLDSLLSVNRALHFTYVQGSTQDQIALFFPGKSEYKSITYFIDRSSGFLVKTISLVKTAQMYATDLQTQLNNVNGFSIIETRFSNYHANSFGSNVFNTSRYYTKQNNSYTVAAGYSSYQIFLGKPGM